MSRTAHLIFNPVSGQGNAEEDLAIIKSHLASELDLVIYETSPECGASELVTHSVRQDVDLVVVSGGDGTINAAAEALVDSVTPLAIIPRGTANAVASTLGIPTDIVDACQVALTGNAQTIDIARCNDRSLVLLAGIGLEAAVVESASRESKNRLGVLAYAIAGIQQLRELEPFDATLETPDKVLSLQCCAITVANMAPPTSILAQGPAEVIADDGWLDVTIVTPKGIGGALAASYELFRSAVNGEVAQHDGIGFLRCQQVKIDTQPPQNVVLDGELSGTTPIDIVCVPQALTLILPSQTSSSAPKTEDLTRLPGLCVEDKDSSNM